MSLIDDVSGFQEDYGAGNPQAGIPLRKVQRGDPLRIPAEAFNTFVDAARRERDRSLSYTRGFGAVSMVDSGVIYVKNNSGSDCVRFSILSVEAPIYKPDDNEQVYKNQVTFVGNTPSADDDTGRFVVLMEPIPDGRIGRGLLSGVCPVKVDVQDEDDGWADVTDGEAGYLTSGTIGGAQILWKESGTGQVWATVRLGVPPVPFRYWLARAAANFAWVEEDSPLATHPGEFRVDSTYGETNVTVIHSDVVLGRRRPISNLILDISAGIDWSTQITDGSPGPDPPPPYHYDVAVNLKIEPILEDFDPSGLNWDAVNALSCGPAVEEHIHLQGTLEMASYEEPPISGLEATHSTDFILPGLRVFGQDQVGAWDLCEAIYGLKISFASQSGEPSTAIWSTTLVPGSCFGLPQGG